SPIFPGDGLHRRSAATGSGPWARDRAEEDESLDREGAPHGGPGDNRPSRDAGTHVSHRNPMNVRALKATVPVVRGVRWPPDPIRRSPHTEITRAMSAVKPAFGRSAMTARTNPKSRRASPPMIWATA